MESRSGLRLSVMMLVLGVLIVTAGANGFRNPPSSARALGLGGGRTALLDDPSAISINPANLAGLEESVWMGSLTLARSRIEYTAPSGERAKTRDPQKWLPSLHAAWPLENSDWVLGLGLTTPYGQSTVWSTQSPFRYTAPYFAELAMVDLNPTVATRLSDRVAVGAGVSLIYSELTFKSIVPWPLLMGQGMNPAQDGHIRVKGDGMAFGANAGVTVRLCDRQTVAASYRAPFDVDYEGSMRVDPIPPPLAGGVAGRSDFDTTVRFPSVVGLGYGIRITDRLRFGAEAEWIEFSRYDSLEVDVGVNNAAGFGQTIPQDWKDTWTAGVGGEFDFEGPWTVRGGYSFLESPIPSRTVAPTLPDADRHVWSVGLSYTGARHAVDLAYAYSLFDDLEVQDNQQPAYNGSYDLSAHLFQVSYRRSF